jgi:Smg protein
MKENVLDVLMYLFQNYMEGEFETEPDRASLQVELLEAGFPPAEVNKAFDWLDDLAERSENPQPSGVQAKHSIRVYVGPELEKLDVESRGFLLFLEHSGILTPQTRELVVERVMALESEMDIERLKWVIMMVLFNQPGQEGAYEWIEDMVFDGYAGNLH